MKNNGPVEQRMSKREITQTLLKPFSWLYGTITTVRNYLYDSGVFESKTTAQFSIVVGNLTVGGTGKTPMIEYLIRNLGVDDQLLTLSRGYGRRSRGFILASSDSTATEIGDEPLQYYQKFGQIMPVAVCESRIVGATRLHEYFPTRKLLLLDDAFQHRPLRPDLAILLNDYNRPFYQDEPFPGGRLRESRRGAKRADAIVITKCPPLGEEEKEQIKRQIARFASSGTPCFFASVRYGTLRGFDDIETSVRSVVLVTGIAQPEPLKKYVAEYYVLDQDFTFPDHHNYSQAEVAEMLKSLKYDQMILTTEKDKVKLRPLAKELGAASRFCYLPIEVDFGTETNAFHEWLRANVIEPLEARQTSS